MIESERHRKNVISKIACMIGSLPGNRCFRQGVGPKDHRIQLETIDHRTQQFASVTCKPSAMANEQHSVREDVLRTMNKEALGPFQQTLSAEHSYVRKSQRRTCYV